MEFCSINNDALLMALWGTACRMYHSRSNSNIPNFLQSFFYLIKYEDISNTRQNWGLIFIMIIFAFTYKNYKDINVYLASWYCTLIINTSFFNFNSPFVHEYEISSSLSKPSQLPLQSELSRIIWFHYIELFNSYPPQHVICVIPFYS